jgi:O-antigen ligase
MSGATTLAQRPENVGGARLALAVSLVASVCGGLAWMAAQSGAKGQFIIVGALLVALVLLLVRERSLALLMLTVLNLQFLFHKSFGTVYGGDATGAPSFYITNVWILIALLLVAWMFNGTLWAELSTSLHRPTFLVPLLALLATVPSLLVAQDAYLVFVDLVRAAWVYMLFLYVAHRVRTRREVSGVVIALFTVALMQSAIALLQWQTGSTLGLAFLGEEEELRQRDLDDGGVPRPSGTVTHPVFLAALTAPIALIALSLSVTLQSMRQRALCLAFVGIALMPLVLSQTRSSLLGFFAAATVLCAAYLWSGRIRVQTAIAALGAAALVALALLERITAYIGDNFGTDQFSKEVDSRLELNGVALNIIHDVPIFGVGLNNYMNAMDKYNPTGVLFEGYPVHNWYLLVWAETGIVGLLGILATLAVLVHLALQLARSRDRLLAGIGAGVAATYLFFIVEEAFGYSLRQEMPLLLFWLLAGLSVACLRMDRGAQAS